MRIILLILFCFANYFTLLSQTEFKIKTSDFAVSPLGELYVQQNNKILKLSNTGEVLYIYYAPKGVDIASFDVSNPLQVLVYSKNFNRIDLLNNKLSIVSSPLLLDSKNISDADILCSSSSGGIWIFDNSERRIKLFSPSMQVVSVSNNLNSLQSYKNDIPVYMSENAGALILVFPESGIFIYNRQLNLLNTIEINNFSFGGAFGNSLTYYKDSILVKYNIENEVSDSLKFNLANMKFSMLGSKLFTSDGKRILISDNIEFK